MADRDQSGRPLPLPSGYDYDFVTELDEDFVCQICQLPLRNAVLTRCGHRFCHDCLNEHFKRIQHPNCPLDRTRLDKDKDIFPDKASERRILSYFVKCPNRCQWEGELRDVENHQQICPYEVVQCPSSNCRVFLARNLIEEHVAVSCQWRIVSCQFCPEKYPKAEEDIHNETCPKFPLNCSNGCEQVVPREQMLKHLETECHLTPVSCPFHDLGCNMKVERRNLETHVREDTTTHLSFACKKLALLQQEFDEEKKTLKKQLDDLKKENNNLLLKVSAQEKEMHKSQMETPMFVWKITGFGDILHQAKVGRNNKIDSDPFYTGKYGYKLKLSVNPNGDGSGRNTHLSAFVIVMRGEHDAILPWPFNQKVTFTLIDQQESLDERQNVTMLFRANTKLENFARPTAEENPGRGYARFMSHEKLKTRRYLVDDTLFIQVDVGPPSL